MYIISSNDKCCEAKYSKEGHRKAGNMGAQFSVKSLGKPH